MSLSARRAWIEIFTTRTRTPIGCVVALRKESVDRNTMTITIYTASRKVALRKESVDRNFYYSDKDADWVRVALRKESVDRN